MLEVDRVSKSFGGVKAVDEVAFAVGAGEIHGLIGPNGAGKTTMINLISGFLEVSSGRIRLDGAEIQKMPAQKRARAGVGRTFQNLRLFGNLSVRRNIEVAESRVPAPDDPGLIPDAIDRFGLNEVLGHTPGSLSYGHMRRLEIVRALALRPKLLMLDEPAAGMNAEETEALFRNLLWLRDRHPCAILLIDHDLKFIMSACEALTVMSMGRVLDSGRPDEVTRNEDVVRAYLGHGETA